ncbi:hypothetical protein ACVW0P_002289 [Mucilaginibacter sp. UYNi724]
MFDQILDLVKSHLGGNPQVAEQIPADKADEVHREVATHIDSGIKEQASQGGIGDMLSSLAGGLSSGSPITSAIEGGLVGSLGSKFGLPPAVTGAIAAALPGLLQKFAHKANDPNDSSITADSITKSISGGGLGSLFGN